MSPVAIIGGGISGLSTAYYLSSAGVSSTLIERRAHLGGVITTEIIDDCVIEGGPDSFLAAKPWAMDLIQELGLAGDVIGSNDHLRVTYLWKSGRLVPLPDGLMLMVPTRIMPMVTTRLLSWPTKVRMGLEWFRRPVRDSFPDRTVADFIENHYGAEAVDYLAEPLLAGVYGGSPRELSASSVLTRFVELEAAYGSLTRGVLAERRKAGRGGSGVLFHTLKGGLGQLIRTLERRIAPSAQVFRGAAEALARCDDGFRIRIDGQWTHTNRVVLACQAYQAGELTAAIDPALAQLLDSIPYSSSMTIALGYDSRTFRHPLNGFGFLVPKRERRRLVACTWVGTKFSHRVPKNRVVLRCFLGGADDPQVLDEPDETLAVSVREELRDIMGVTEEPSFTHIARWPRSMAQYTVGHRQRVEQIESRVRAIPGLHLAGNAYHGIGIPDCVRMGKQAAEAIAASVAKSG
jgi:oxygen-dependent protoporphyrinogen oxidase